MTPSEAKSALERLCKQAIDLTETAKTAQRNNKSLRSDNHYGHRFQDGITAMSGTLAQIAPVMAKITDPSATSAYESLKRSCETLKSFDADNQTRMTATKTIDLACHSRLFPALDLMDAPAVPASEQVLSSSVVKGKRGYFERAILYANGNYAQGWYDPASVMIRKFVEMLIIEVYEHEKRSSEVKTGGVKENNFLMLNDLIDVIMSDAKFNLQRETKATLPLLKILGDRSAHNRRYFAMKDDVDKIIPGLRVVAHELLHLAGLE